MKLFPIETLVTLLCLMAGSAYADIPILGHNGTAMSSTPDGTGLINVEMTEMFRGVPGTFGVTRLFFENAAHQLFYNYLGPPLEPPVLALRDQAENDTATPWTSLQTELVGGDDFVGISNGLSIGGVPGLGTQTNGSVTVDYAFVTRSFGSGGGLDRASITLFFADPVDPGEWFRLAYAIDGPLPGFDLRKTPNAVFTSPTITSQPVSQCACNGSTAAFSVLASGSGTPGYQWQVFNAAAGVWTNLVGQASSSLTLGLVDVADVGDYRVLVTDDAGVAASAIATLTIDSAAPQLNVPGSTIVDITVPPGGGCEAVVDLNPLVQVSDDCDPAPVLAGTRSDGLLPTDPFPCGTTAIGWTATDACGHVSQGSQSVTINAWTNVMATIGLQGGSLPPTLDRCIAFELHRCNPATSSCAQLDPYVVDQALTFTNGVASTLFQVPCGQYECITIRDRLHALPRTISPLPDNGSDYVADVTTAGVGTLIGGNLNDDCWIDVLDFGLLASQWQQTYDGDDDMIPDGTTPCGVFVVHADFDGDGVTFTADFTFVQINIWRFGELPCCGSGPLCGAGQHAPHGPREGPVRRISLQDLRRLGLSEAAAGDVNRDGWLDVRDMEIWARGRRPRSRRPVRLPLPRSRGR